MPSKPHINHRHEHAKLDAATLIRGAGLKVTKPRIAILEVLINDHGPFAAEEIFSKRSALDLKFYNFLALP